MVQEYILVEAGRKEEVASRLVTERRQPYSRKSWWTCVNAPRPHDERVSLMLSHRLITYDLFCHVIVIFTASLESSCNWNLHSFECTALRVLLPEFSR